MRILFYRFFVLIGLCGLFVLEASATEFQPEIHGRIQTRFDYQAPEFGSEDWEGAFLVRRARIRVKGKVLTSRLSYMFQSDFGQGKVEVKVLTLDYALKPGSLHFKIGHGRRPFGRHRMTPSRLTEFAERSGIHSVFGGGRDIGVLLHNGWSVRGRGGLEWSLGLMNGSPANVDLSAPYTSLPGSNLFEFGQGSTNNMPSEFNPIIVGRIGHNDPDMIVYSEADLEGGGARFSWGLSCLINYGEGDSLADGPLTSWGLDFAYKNSGTSLSGVFYTQEQHSGRSIFDGKGLMLQLGHVFSGWIQPVIRIGGVELVEEPIRNEYRVGLNFYILGHALKWQNELGYLTTKANDGEASTDFWEARTQLQLAF